MSARAWPGGSGSTRSSCAWPWPPRRSRAARGCSSTCWRGRWCPRRAARPPTWARLVGRRDTWMTLSGITLLLLSVLLLLRKWGLLVLRRDRVAAAAGGRRRRADLAPERGVRAARGAAAARPERTRPDRAGRPAAHAAAADPGARPGGDRRDARRRRPALVFLWLNDALAPARDVILAVLVVVVALTLILAPWWLRLVRGLTAERAERIRSQERAEVAAHLHDSVLQTLALVQKRADDPRAVAEPGAPPGARAARVAERRRGPSRASRWPARSRRPPPRWRRPTACRSTSSRSATRRSTSAARRSWPPRARRS